MVPRWCVVLLAVLAVPSAVPSATEAPHATDAPPALVPGEDLAVLQALGWAAWDLEHDVLRLELQAPAGASWQADDVLRLETAVPFEVRGTAWSGDLRPERLVMRFWSEGALCAQVDLLAPPPDAAGSCMGQVRAGLELSLPSGADGSGAARVDLLPRA